MKKLGLIAIILLSMLSCTSNSSQENSASPHSPADSSSKEEKQSFAHKKSGYLKKVGDSVEIPSFEIEVSLSPKAEQKLKDSHETVIVKAYFSGQPKDTTMKKHWENGEMPLAAPEIELKNSRLATFKGVKFSKALYDSLADKDIDLLINIYSGRRSTNVNLLDCDILQDKMSNVMGKHFILKGKLIGEEG